MGDFQCCNLAKVNILRLAKQSDLIGMNCICTFGPAFAFVRFRKIYHTLRTGLLVSILCTSPRDQFLYVFFLTLETLRSFENKQSHVSLSAIRARKVYICVEKKYLPIPFFWNLPHYHQNKLVSMWQFISFAVTFCVSLCLFLPLLYPILDSKFST